MGIENLKQESAPSVPDDLAQSLEKLGIDPSFVIPQEHRRRQVEQQSESCGECSRDIPVIDLSALFAGSQDGKGKIVQEIRDASREWGFFQVINHGVSLELLRDVEREARDFFALPLEEKRKIRRSSVNPLGFYESELTKNTRDWKEVFDYVVKRKDDFPPEIELFFENQWPEGREKFREACEEWIKAVDDLGFKVLELLALSLGVDPQFFFEFFGEGDNNSIMRLNFYPKCPIPDLVLGVSRHKDQGALTVLVQDEVGGLEVRRKDGEWIRVTPHKEAFVINVGDLMQVWSNDMYKSVEHRVVVNENRDRFSSPYFLFPSYKTDVAPIESLTDPVTNPPKYARFNYGEFDKNRKDSNFKRLGVENLQIYHYAIN